MEIWNVPVANLIPYERNAKQHPPEQVHRIAESLKQFGWQQPIVIDKDNVVIIGHGRLLAAKEIGLNFVPCVKADQLTTEQVNALRLADNKLNESAWDFEALEQEIRGLSLADFDMEQFGFSFDDVEPPDFEDMDAAELAHQTYKEQEQYADANVLQLEKGQFEADGQYDIPIILPEEIPEVTEWIGFNYMLSEKHPEGKGVHCFVNDYQFERLWRNPDRYIEKLRRFAVVASPDFSPYGDMPFCLQLFNHYRKHWVARYLQENDVHVIPTIRASTDSRSKQFYLDGEPHNSPVIISSMYTNDDVSRKIYRDEYDTMFDTLNPSAVFIYGKQYGWERGNIIHVETFTDKRFRGGNNGEGK